MGKVIRINDKNLQYLEDLRELFAKVKFYNQVYWDDNRLLTMALANLKWDFRTYMDETERKEVSSEMDKILETK